MGCYKALHRAHVPADFIDTTALESGQAARYAVLYLPYCYALSAKSAAAIREFVRRGGTVWADGLVCWKDEQGTTLQFPPGPLSDVFGFTVEDIQSVWEPFALTDSGDQAGELWRCLIPFETSGATLRGTDGRPVAVEHRFGQGRAIYYATALTYGCLCRDDPRVVNWIAAPALEASRDLPGPSRRTRRPRCLPRPSGSRALRCLPQQLGPRHPCHRPPPSFDPRRRGHPHRRHRPHPLRRLIRRSDCRPAGRRLRRPARRIANQLAAQRRRASHALTLMTLVPDRLRPSQFPIPVSGVPALQCRSDRPGTTSICSIGSAAGT